MNTDNDTFFQFKRCLSQADSEGCLKLICHSWNQIDSGPTLRRYYAEIVKKKRIYSRHSQRLKAHLFTLGPFGSELKERCRKRILDVRALVHTIDFLEEEIIEYMCDLHNLDMAINEPIT